MQEIEARRTIDPALEPGEQVHWCGTPVMGRLATRKLGGWLLRLGVFGVVAYFLIPTSSGSRGAGAGDLVHTVIDVASRDARLLVPSGFALALLAGFVALLVLDRRRLGRTAYAITDRRLIAVVGPKAKVPWSLTPEEVAYVKVKDLGGGMGTVRFNQYRPTQGSGSRNLDRLFAFERLEDADRLARRVRSWLAEQEATEAANARDVRPLADRELGFELQVPVSWKEGPPPECDSAFHALAATSGVHPASTSGRRLLELHGPLGASLALEVAPAGTWTMEQAGDLEHGLARLLLKVVEGPEDLVHGPTPGFRVTCEMRLARPLPGSHGTSPEWGFDVLIEFIVIEHGDSQLRFTLSWMSRFERMKEVLENVVDSFQPVAR